MNTPIAMLLSRKGSAVYSVAPSVTVADAVRTMNEYKVGSILVMEGRRLIGIFTERDVLTRVVAAGRNPQVTRVHDVMTGNLETVPPDATVEQVMQTFVSRRCRHLPVVTDGSLLGLISIGDISRWMLDQHRAEAEHLREYIHGATGLAAGQAPPGEPGARRLLHAAG